MGRGEGGLTGAAAAVTRTERRPAPDRALTRMLTGFQQAFYQTSGLTHRDVAHLPRDQQIEMITRAAAAEFDRLSERAAAKKNTDLGRGGRLMIAVNDMIEASALISSPDPDDQRLAQVLSDNALRHIGRIMATVAPRHPFTEQWGALMEQYGSTRGVQQIEFLHRRGLISPDEAAELKANIRGLYREAFASRAANPRWVGYNTMERAARALDALSASPSAGEQADAVIANAVSDLSALISRSREYINDPRHRKFEWDVMRNCNNKITRAQALVAAARDSRSRALNAAIADSGMIQRHDEVVQSFAPQRHNPPVIALSRREWLDQIANSQQYITHDASGVLASHIRDFGILFSPEDATAALAAHEHGRLDEVLLHEKFHTAERHADRRLGYDSDLHRFWEEEILHEGAVQAMTLHALTENQSDWDTERSRISGYHMIAALTSRLAQQSGDPRAFLTDLVSQCQKNERLGYIASRFGTDPDQLLSVLDPVMYEWEDRADTAHRDPRFHADLDRAVSALSAAGVKVAA